MIDASFAEAARVSVAAASPDRPGGAAASPARASGRPAGPFSGADPARHLDLNPRAISYFGLNLMLNLAVPVALATVGQMFVMAGNDLDLSIGTFVGFVGCVTATVLHDNPALGAAILVGCIAVYALLGALIHLRGYPRSSSRSACSSSGRGWPSCCLPKPGGHAPDWLQR